MCSATWSGALTAVCDATVIGWPAAFMTCSACSFPLERSSLRVGTKRKMKLFGMRATVPGLFAPPMSSAIQTLPSLSF